MAKETGLNRKTTALILSGLLLIVLLVSACTQSHEDRLRKIEDVLNVHPDSAWVMLCQDSAYLDKYSKCDRMKYLLLRTEAMNKLFYAMDTIRYMDDVLGYYYSHGSEEEKAQANYMMGSVYRDKGNSPLALQYYNEAVAKLDTTKSDCDYRLLSKIYGQMADIYDLQRYPQMELKMLDKKAFCAKEAKDTMGYFLARERRASVFYMLGASDSVYNIAIQSYQDYKKIGRNDYAAASLAPLHEIYLRRKDYMKAKQSLDEYRTESKLLDDDGEPLYPRKEYYYNYLGWYYKEIGQMDSALWCYRKLLNYPSQIENLEAGYEGLMSVYAHKSMVDSVVKYAHLYADANDTANFRNSASEVSRVQALYDYTESQNVAVRKTEEAKNVWKVLFMSLLLIVLLLVVLRKLRNRVRKIKTQYDSTKTELASTQKEMDLQKQKMSKLRGMLSFYQTNANEEKWESESMVMNSKIVQAFQTCANGGKLPTVSEWRDLLTLIESSMPKFWEKMSSFNDTLSTDEFRICVLSRLSFSPSQVANLLGVSKQSVTNKRKKIVRLLFESGDIKKLDYMIKQLK